MILIYHFSICGHGKFTQRSQYCLQKHFLEVSQTFCVLNIRINFILEYNKANGNNDNKHHKRNQEGNQINNTVQNHLHQKAIVFENPNEIDHFHES